MLRRLFALQPLRSKTLLRPDSSDPIRQRGVQVKSWLSHLSLSRRTGAADAAPLRTLHADRMLRSHRNRREPVIAVGFLAVDDAVKLLLQRFGHGTDLAPAHGNFVDR